MPPRSTSPETRRAAHWRRLGLLAGAPECVIKAAHRYLIEIHHPDRGGSLEAAQQINVAADEVRGSGLPAKEHVAANFGGEPWHVLGVMANADRALVDRVGRALAQEVQGQPRLSKRVTWAIANFGRASGAKVPRTQAQPRRRTQPAASRESTPAAAGRPEGLVERIDFGTLEWRAQATLDIRLTWREHPPYRVIAVGTPPVRASVTESKALTGRFVVKLDIDWESEELSRGSSARGYTLDSVLVLRWASGGEATIRVRGVLLFAATVSAGSQTLDLGTVRLGVRTRTQLILQSGAATDVLVETPAWLVRVDGSGRAVDGPLRLAANAPMRVVFDVAWEPIRLRGKASIAAGRPLRPTGTVRVRWSCGSLDIPAAMVVETKR